MKSLELFCGAGGASLGLRRAGLESVLHVDCEEDACATMTAAGFDHVLCEYVQYLKREQLPDVPFWWSSTPCPAWSMSGLRGGASDGRNGYPHLFRALSLRTPRWLVVEQVEGISFHRGRCPTRRGGNPTPFECPACYLSEVIFPTLEKFFPVVRSAVLDAADLGVPQYRNRHITICGPTEVPWPLSTHSDLSLEEAKDSGLYWKAVADGALYGRELPPGSDGCRPHRTMRQVLPALRAKAFVLGGGRHPGEPGEQRFYRDLTDDPSTTISAQLGGSAGNLGPFVFLSGTRGEKGPLVVSADDPSPTVSTAGDLYESSRPPAKKKGRSARPVDLDEPSPAISTAGDDLLLEGRPDWWHRASSVDEPSRTIGSSRNASVSFRDEEGRLYYVRGNGRAASEPDRLDRPAPTVSTAEEKGTRASEVTDFDFNGGPDRASDAAFLAVGRRRLDPVECAILQDFPGDYPFQGSKGSVYAQIGNAVPSTLAEVLGRAVLKADRRLRR